MWRCKSPTPYLPNVDKFSCLIYIPDLQWDRTEADALPETVVVIDSFPHLILFTPFLNHVAPRISLIKITVLEPDLKQHGRPLWPQRFVQELEPSWPHQFFIVCLFFNIFLGLELSDEDFLSSIIKRR